MKQSFATVQIMELVMKRVWKQTLNVNIIYKNVQGNVFRFAFTLNISRNKCERNIRQTQTSVYNYWISRKEIPSCYLSVDLCYQAAKKAGKKYFAVQYYGECWVDKDDSTYMKHGPSTACWSGVGKGNTNYVYKVEW